MQARMVNEIGQSCLSNSLLTPRDCAIRVCYLHGCGSVDRYSYWLFHRLIPFDSAGHIRHTVMKLSVYRARTCRYRRPNNCCVDSPK